MKLKKTALALWSVMFFGITANAAPYLSPDVYTVDLDAPVPDLEPLEREVDALTNRYNPDYEFTWNMGPEFRASMSSLITSFGGTERRLHAPDEDALYETIKALPKEYYPYIGPQLHASIGISEKIRNMPGIKETKNTFPKVIAPQLEGIEELEFLPPQMYFLLMPQMWPSDVKFVEHPQETQPRQAALHAGGSDPEFFARVFAKVPAEGFGGLRRDGQRPSADDLRTLSPTLSSPLTGADVRAFAATLPAVAAFSTLENVIAVNRAGLLLDYWEEKNGVPSAADDLRDLVNPCQRLALKIRWAGLETPFLKAVAPQAFDIKSWAYTCDKTIKAYRIARMPLAQLQALRAFKGRLLDAYLHTLNPKWREQQYRTMDAVVEMYNAPRADVLAAVKNEKLLTKNIVPLRRRLITEPIYY
jgi:hypothetical protein